MLAGCRIIPTHVNHSHQRSFGKVVIKLEVYVVDYTEDVDRSL